MNSTAHYVIAMVLLGLAVGHLESANPNPLLVAVLALSGVGLGLRGVLREG